MLYRKAAHGCMNVVGRRKCATVPPARKLRLDLTESVVDRLTFSELVFLISRLHKICETCLYQSKPLHRLIMDTYVGNDFPP